jgi:putative ABC transport system permease protein
MLGISAYDPTGLLPLDPEAINEAFDTAVDRYQVEYSSRSGYLDTRAQFATGVEPVYGQTVDPDYGTMHRVTLKEGEWFTDRDETRLAPAIIINEVFWQRLGSPDLATHPTVEILGADPYTAVVIGITPSPVWDTSPSMIMLYSAWLKTVTPEALAQQQPTFEMWVPPEISEQLMPLVERDMAGALGEGTRVDVNRQDYLAYPGFDESMMVLRLLIGGGSVLVLLLGALGLVNISLVTVRQRIREIGIRRSFGATAGRVFFAVMMESIVATAVAGVVGVIVAVLIVRSPLVQDVVNQGLVDAPAFPAEAAGIGILSAVVVGALAGLLPALVAVRVKVIDAIRY